MHQLSLATALIPEFISNRRHLHRGSEQQPTALLSGAQPIMHSMKQKTQPSRPLSCGKMTEITKPSRRIKLWRLLIAITVVGVALAILPNQLVA